ncbi:MAG: Flp family type IVb pilin [Chloroflexota bacterium]
MITEWWIRAGGRLRAILRGDAEKGQGLVEYALILAFIAIFVVVALKFLQPHISNELNTVANGL